MDVINTLREQALSKISGCSDLRQLDELRVAYLGKKGEITSLLKSLGSMEPSERKAFGQAVNAARDRVTTALSEQKTVLERIAMDQKLARETLDVTLPGRRN